MSTFLSQYLSAPPLSSKKSAVVAYLAALDYLSETNPTIAKSILDELRDQRSSLKLIASENYSSYAVQLSMANWLTDKYAEGYPRHRFYAGCDAVDAIEEEAASTAKTLFGADYAYVQPHSGSDANLVALFAILMQRVQSKEIEKLNKKNLDALSPEEMESLRALLFKQKLMGLALDCGGHLSHGFKHNFSGKVFQGVPYGIDPTTSRLNYDTIREIAKREKPLILLAGYSAYPRRIDFAKMREIADEVGAVLMVDMAHFAGLVAGGVFTGNENPIPFAHIVTSTTHKTLRGPRGGFILAKDEFAEILNKGCPLVLGGPLPHILAAKAIAFKEALSPDFKTYAKKIVDNAKALAEALQQEGFAITTNGTDNHLMVVDLTSKGLTGRQAEGLLRDAKITVNRNTIPFDPNGAWHTSGIRLGTAALTTLGMGRDEMKIVARWIATILKSAQKGGEPIGGRYSVTVAREITERVMAEIKELLSHFPLYPEIPTI